MKYINAKYDKSKTKITHTITYPKLTRGYPKGEQADSQNKFLRPEGKL